MDAIIQKLTEISKSTKIQNANYVLGNYLYEILFYFEQKSTNISFPFEYIFLYLIENNSHQISPVNANAFLNIILHFLDQNIGNLFK